MDCKKRGLLQGMQQPFENLEIEREIADLIWLRLYQRRHGLAPVLGALEFEIGDYGGKYETDGRRLYLDASRLREEFRSGSERLCLEVLHMLAHCLLCHPFFQSTGARTGSSCAKSRIKEQVETDLRAWDLAEQIWGEPLFFLREAEKETDLGTQANLLFVDSHENWGRQQEWQRLAKASASGAPGRSGEGDAGDKSLLPNFHGKSRQWWERQRENLKREIEDKRRRAGTVKKSETVRYLVPEAGHRGDYRELLKSLSSFREEGRTNQEEFQYSWYLYGIQEYGNVPLIEPLEYREERKIEDLVIVIDTSASCEKELVQVFLEETKGILEQEQLFFQRFCLHIIQCDNQIQKDDRIGNSEEFAAYLEELTIQGGGGTDFCPAFAHIGQLKRAGEFRDLRGVLYFTDGSGIYPKEKPDYEVYFVMLKGRYDAIDMPEWVHRLILEERRGA